MKFDSNAKIIGLKKVYMFDLIKNYLVGVNSYLIIIK